MATKDRIGVGVNMRDSHDEDFLSQEFESPIRCFFFIFPPRLITHNIFSWSLFFVPTSICLHEFCCGYVSLWERRKIIYKLPVYKEHVLRYYIM